MEKWNVDEADRLLGIVAECHKRKEAVKRKQDADGTASFVGTKERNNASIVGPKEQDGTATATTATTTYGTPTDTTNGGTCPLPILLASLVLVLKNC